jgi:hypothetical protein
MNQHPHQSGTWLQHLFPVHLRVEAWGKRDSCQAIQTIAAEYNGWTYGRFRLLLNAEGPTYHHRNNLTASSSPVPIPIGKRTHMAATFYGTTMHT